ncbi:MAG: VWA domain-containing protein [bacterium]
MGFLQPALLAALALVAIPLILHLFTRRRVQQVVFPAFMLLIGSKRRSMRILTLRQWLVLLCRIAAIALLALAFAQPVLHNSRLSLPGTRDRAALHIILDNSPSMSWERGGVTIFERAKSAAEKLVSRAAYEDEITVELACGDAAGANVMSAASAISLIKKAKPGSCRAPLDLKINRAIRELRLSPASERRLIIFSDFQSNGFGLKPPDAAKGDPIIIADALAAGMHRANAWVESVSLPLFPLTGEESPICFRVESSAPVKTPIVAALDVDSRKRGEQTLTPDSKGTARGCFSITLGEAGRRRGRIAISGDRMRGDNARYFTFDAHREIPAALITSESATRDAARGSFYIARALRSVGGAARMAILPPDSLSAQALSKYRVAIVPDGSALSPANLSTLGDFLAGGGGVFISAGDEQQPADIIARTLFGGGVSIVAQKKPSARTDKETSSFLAVGELDSARPLFEKLSGKAGAAFRETRFNRPAQIRVNGADVSTLAELSDGSALLAERRVGRGKVILFASRFDPAETNLPLKPAFIPFIMQLMKYLGEINRTNSNSYTLGGGIRIQEDVPASVESLVARNAETVAPIELVRVTDGGGGVFASRADSELHEGVYEIRSGKDKIIDTFAVNSDPREGQLKTLSASAFKKIYSGYKVYFLESGRFSVVDKIIALAYTRRAAALWFPALLAAILLLLAETVLSNRR